MERTALKELDREQASATAPGSQELRRFEQSKDPNKDREILEGILEKYGDRPLAPIAAWCLANVLADANASQAEVRSASDRAIRLAARYGSEMELAAVHRVADHLIASGRFADLALDYARRADAMLSPYDSVALRIAVVESLASALRRAGQAEDIKAVEYRLAKLKESAGVGNGQALIPTGGRSLRTPGRRRASPPSGPRPRGAADRDSRADRLGAARRAGPPGSWPSSTMEVLMMSSSRRSSLSIPTTGPGRS